MAQKNLILLAEDDEDDQELIRLAFSKVTQEHDFKIVNNGQELLDALSRQGDMPCMIILDLNMPLLDGLQTLNEIKKEPKYTKIPIVIFTTSDSDDNKRNSYSSGAADYVIKPSTMKEFVSAAQKILTYCH
ncbi:MAG TPA: response regulator [Chryseosolibacter sp.]|nr:response regulator [Chryseosolibacter sp.]